MAFQSNSEFVAGNATPHFTPHLSPPLTVSESKDSITTSVGPFSGMTQDWHEVGANSKHAEEGMGGMAVASTSTLDAGHFKHETTTWSPNDHLATLSHHNDFESSMTDYAVHGGPAPLGMAYDPNSQSNTGDPSSASSNNAMNSVQGSAQYAMPSQGQAWVSTPVTDGFDFSPLAPQGTRSTPVFATSTSILRRDGIRKKNARFEIPAERNLRTIDQLIAQTTDETEIKELKQQKRLLRNRQAALDSRQRKKQHTERLEEEKKQYTSILSEMDDELNTMKMRETEWLRQRDELLQNNARLHQWCQQLQAEKEEAIRAHTVESGQLRKENSMLLEQLQHVDASNLSAPASTGLPAEFSEFDQLTIQNNSWEQFPLQSGFDVDASRASESSVSHLPTKQSSAVSKDEKDHTSTLAFMLLLLGAWFVSRGSTSESRILPAVPDSLRVASNTVIEGLYRDSGIVLPEQDLMQPHDVSGKGMIHVSTESDADPMQSAPGDGIVSHNSHMHMDEEMFDHVPTAQHVNTVSPDAVRVGQLMRDAVRSVGIADTSTHATTSEPFVRSLLIDKVPQQVLKDFASMVARSHRHSKAGMGARHDDQQSYD